MRVDGQERRPSRPRWRQGDDGERRCAVSRTVAQRAHASRAVTPVLGGPQHQALALDALLGGNGVERLAHAGANTAARALLPRTGLSGVGKTVLLGEFRRRSEARNWVTVEAEMTKGTEFGPQVGLLVRRALLCISPRARWETGPDAPPESSNPTA